MLFVHSNVFNMVSDLRLDSAQKKILDDFVMCKIIVYEMLENFDGSDLLKTYKL